MAPRLDLHLDCIEEAIAGLGDCRLLLIDPVTAYLGGIDDHRNSDLRGLILLMKNVAERQRMAILLVTHLSKVDSTNGKHRVMGSMAYVGASPFQHDLHPRSVRPLGPSRPDLRHRRQPRQLDADPGLHHRGRRQGPHVVFQQEPIAITTEQALIDEMQGGLGRSQAPGAPRGRALAPRGPGRRPARSSARSRRRRGPPGSARPCSVTPARAWRSPAADPDSARVPSIPGPSRRSRTARLDHARALIAPARGTQTTRIHATMDEHDKHGGAARVRPALPGLEYI